MARSFSSAKHLSAVIADNISVAINRRGYAAAAASQGASAAKSAAMMKKKEGGEDKAGAWVPDPVTGYYRPENSADEIDVADLRKTHLAHNKH